MAAQFSASLKKDASVEGTTERNKSAFNSITDVLDAFASYNSENKDDVPPTGVPPKTVDSADGANS